MKRKVKAARKAGLNAKQAMFVREYLVDLNATQAAIRAGYSQKTGEWIGPQLLKKTHVAEAVQAGMAERAKRVGLSADDVLLQLKRIVTSDPRKFFNADGSLKRIEELDDDCASALASMEVVERDVNMRSAKDPDEGEDQLIREVEQTKKIRFWDKNSAIEKAMKHLRLLTDRMEHTGPGGGPLQPLVQVYIPDNRRESGRHGK